ncbi:MAG: hypothetical protein QXK37_04480 [Candidatus Woesearchaeota archaeon]
MRQKMRRFIPVLFVLFLIGCTNNKATNPSVQAPFYGGYDGLVAEFLPIGTVAESKKYEVWEDDMFPVSILVKNKGEYTIPAHEVLFEIKGVARSDFTGIDFETDNPDELEKVSEFNKEGGQDVIDFGNAKYTALVGTFYDANFYIYFTYPYETYINIPKVCYKENIKDDTVCKVDETKQAFSSGGPIQVGTVKESYIGKGKIALEIPIRNVQKGKAKAFKNDDFRPEWDEVNFEVNTPDWECRSMGDTSVARIQHPTTQRSGSDQTVIYCTNKNLEKGALYTKSFTITLRYYYQDYIAQIIRIKDNPQ